MAISDLQARQGNVALTAEVIEKGDARTFDKFGKQGRVCNAKIKDDSGQVTLTLWNDDIDKVNVGDRIKITNGWVSEYQGELQLSTGKFGKLEVLGKGEKSEAPGAAPLPKDMEKKPAPKPAGDDLKERGSEIKEVEKEEEDLEDVGDEEFVDEEEE